MDGTSKPTRLEDGADLEAFVGAHDVALVECYTSGGSKCQAMEPVLGTVARATDVPVGLLNPGDDIALLKRLELDSVPTLLVYRDGTEIARRAEGFIGAAGVLEFLEDTAPAAVDRN